MTDHLTWDTYTRTFQTAPTGEPLCPKCGTVMVDEGDGETWHCPIGRAEGERMQAARAATAAFVPEWCTPDPAEFMARSPYKRP